MVLRLRQYNIGYTADGSCAQNDRLNRYCLNVRDDEQSATKSEITHRISTNHF